MAGFLSLAKGVVAIQLLVLVLGICRVEAGFGLDRFTLRPQRSFGVEGVIYCKSCMIGFDPLKGAFPLAGATARLECNYDKTPLIAEGTTDKNGYFFIKAPLSNISYRSMHRCKVFLAYSPSATCNKPTNFNGGVTGAHLMDEKVLRSGLVTFSCGTLAYGPATCPIP